MSKVLMTMFRSKNEGPETLWEMIDKAAKISNLETSVEVNIGIREKFKIERENKSVFEIATTIPLPIPLLLSDRQLECYLVYNYLVAAEKLHVNHITPKSLMKIDELACKHYDPAFLMGTLIKFSIIENSWFNFINSVYGKIIMSNYPEEVIPRFNNLSFLHEHEYYAALVKFDYHLEISNELKDLSKRLDNVKISSSDCVIAICKEFESITFDIKNPELFSNVIDLIRQQVALDLP